MFNVPRDEKKGRHDYCDISLEQVTRQRERGERERLSPKGVGIVRAFLQLWKLEKKICGRETNDATSILSISRRNIEREREREPALNSSTPLGGRRKALGTFKPRYLDRGSIAPATAAYATLFSRYEGSRSCRATIIYARPWRSSSIHRREKSASICLPRASRALSPPKNW